MSRFHKKDIYLHSNKYITKIKYKQMKNQANELVRIATNLLKISENFVFFRCYFKLKINLPLQLNKK